MPFSSYDMETAGFNDLFLFGADLFLKFIKELSVYSSDL